VFGLAPRSSGLGQCCKRPRDGRGPIGDAGGQGGRGSLVRAGAISRVIGENRKVEPAMIPAEIGGKSRDERLTFPFPRKMKGAKREKKE